MIEPMNDEDSHLFNVRDPHVSGLDCEDDIPIAIRRALLKAATEAQINYYWLCAIYRKGRDDGKGASEGVLTMAVARLGGIVEGNPTGRHNFLQRIDALVATESEARRLAGVVAQLQQDTGELRDFIERRGYRRCDIAACNCGSFHGGLAEDRLREISESLSDAGVNGGTVHGGVLRIIADKEAAEGALAHLREQVREAFEAGFHARPTPTQTGWQFDPEGINMRSNAKQAYAAYTAALASRGDDQGPGEEDKKD